MKPKFTSLMLFVLSLICSRAANVEVFKVDQIPYAIPTQWVSDEVISKDFKEDSIYVNLKVGKEKIGEYDIDIEHINQKSKPNDDAPFEGPTTAFLLCDTAKNTWYLVEYDKDAPVQYNLTEVRIINFGEDAKLIKTKGKKMRCDYESILNLLTKLG